MSEEGGRKLGKIRELQVIAEKLNCSMAQLAIGEFDDLTETYSISIFKTNLFLLKAWCLKNESVHSVLLGASSVEQLIENIQSLLVKYSSSYLNMGQICCSNVVIK